MKCARTACAVSLDGKGHYAIWNNQCSGTDEPRRYCIPCGRKIIYFNERDDKIKLRYELHFAPIPEESK